MVRCIRIPQRSRGPTHENPLIHGIAMKAPTERHSGGPNLDFFAHAVWGVTAAATGHPPTRIGMVELGRADARLESPGLYGRWTSGFYLGRVICIQ